LGSRQHRTDVSHQKIYGLATWQAAHQVFRGEAKLQLEVLEQQVVHAVAGDAGDHHTALAVSIEVNNDNPRIWTSLGEQAMAYV